MRLSLRLTALTLAALTAFALAGSLSGLVKLGVPGSVKPRATSLPYPYCYPDAQPPVRPPDPWPGSELGPDGGFISELDPRPLVQAIAVPDDVTVQGPLPYLDENGSPDPVDPIPRPLKATVMVGRIVWQSPIQVNAAGSPLLLPGPYQMAASEEVWNAVQAALEARRKIVLGIYGYVTPDGVHDVAFAMDPDPESPTFYYGVDSLRETLIFRTFLGWSGNPIRGAPPLDFVVAWNEEADSPTSDPRIGPIGSAWQTFYDQFVLHKDSSVPPLDPTLRWAEAPPLCRNMGDAPEAVRNGLFGGSVWVHVPSSWSGLTDAVICLRIALGSLGCSILDPYGGWAYLDFPEVYAQPGEDIVVQVGMPGSWVERVNIGVIPWAVFAANHYALVELDPTLAPTSYALLKANPRASTGAVAVPLTYDQEQALRASAPIATPDPDCPGSECSN
jgi:hypothetical protein